MKTRLVPALAAVVFLAGCFEDPVGEAVEIEVASDGSAEVTASVAFSFAYEAGSPIGIRLARVREDYLHSRDPWTRRFERLDIDFEARTIAKELAGERLELSAVRHSVGMEFAELGRLFVDSGVVLTPIEGVGWREISVLPGRGSRASAEERRLFDRAFGRASGAIAAYLDEAGALYDYLAERPDRAAPVFSALFHDFVDVEPGAYPLTDDETERVTRARAAMEAAAEQIAGEASGLPWTLNELSSLVFDPLPAAISVCPPRDAEEVEGFVQGEAGCWDIPRIDLLGAVEALEGYWIAPDPLAEWVRLQRADGEETFEPEAFAARERARLATPSAADLRRVLQSALQHEPVYRVRWRVEEAQ